MARILLVEDDIDILLLVEHALRTAGHHVDATQGRMRAESLVDRNQYDLVVADGKLDNGTGMMVADKAVAKGAKALIFTGNAAQLSKEDLLRYPYLMKPIRAPELLAEIDQVLAEAVPVSVNEPVAVADGQPGSGGSVNLEDDGRPTTSYE